MNKRHVLMQAIGKSWWSFLCALAIIIGVTAAWSNLNVPWWFVVSTSLIVIALACLEVAEKYAIAKRDHYDF